MKMPVFAGAVAALLGFTVAVSFADETPPYIVQPSTSGAVVVPAQQPATVVVTPPPAPPPPPPKDEDHHSWGQLELSGGKAMFKGSSGDFLDDSPAVDIGLFGPLGRAGQMGMEFGYVTGSDLKGPLPGRINPTINGVPATGAYTTDVKAHIMQITPEVRIGPLLRAGTVAIMPYIVGGGGFYWTHYNNDSLDFTQGSASVSSTNDYNGGWNAGGGITIGLKPGVGISADVRYHDIMYSHGPDTTYLLPEGKLVFLF